MFGKRKTKLYFAPHQDDELLTLGVDICASVLRGDDVHVILCTDGSKSSIRGVLANGKACRRHEGLHTYDLSLPEFIQARDREFTDSCLALGVKPDHIHIPKDRNIDGSLYSSKSQEIIRRYLSLLGEDAVVCTHSPLNGPNQHKDHRTLGQAADSLLKQGVIKQAKFFIEPYLYSYAVDMPQKYPGLPVVTEASDQVKERVKAAVGSYTRWDPENGRYAVGYHSVSTEFNDFLNNPCSYSYRKKSDDAASQLDRLYEQHRKWLALQYQKQLYYSLGDCPQPDLGSWKLVSVQPKATDDYQAFCQKHDYPFRDKDLQRIADGSSFWCLTDEAGSVITTGWLAYKQHFYIGETDYGFDMDQSDAAILFDFVTKPEYRGQGLYGLLLNSMVYHSHGPSNYIIYTSPVNTASSRGILKAGFQPDGTFCGADGSMQAYLKAAGFTSITRKYQFRGLRVMP